MVAVLVLVLENPPRRIVQIIELPAAYRVDEQSREHRPQDQGDGQEKEDRVHFSSLRTPASTREAPQITSPLENGIRTAATSGLTNPATAADTARML